MNRQQSKKYHKLTATTRLSQKEMASLFIGFEAGYSLPGRNICEINDCKSFIVESKQDKGYIVLQRSGVVV